MRYAAPGTVRSDDRPPVATDIAPSPGAAVRISAQQRQTIHPQLWPARLAIGIEPAHPYVRAYWSAIVGTGAVADLLRLITAARRDAAVLHPLFVHVLTAEGLAVHHAGQIWVHDLVPPLGPKHVRRLIPRLQRSHPEDLAAALADTK